MINTVMVGDKWFNSITDASNEADEVYLYGDNHQTKGYKIYHINSNSLVGIPDEYFGYWRCRCTWGDMIGVTHEGYLERVYKRVKVVEANIWEPIGDEDGQKTQA